MPNHAITLKIIPAVAAMVFFSNMDATAAQVTIPAQTIQPPALTIPKQIVTVPTITGPAGPQGIQGIQGIQGPAGPAGPVGPAGPTGPAGSGGSGGSITGVTSASYAAGVLTLTFPDGTTGTIPVALVAPPPPPPPPGTHNQMAVTMAPNTAVADLPTALGLLADRGVLTIMPGTYQTVAHVGADVFPNGVTITGQAGKTYQTTFDGQGGVGNNHRLSFGKGCIHIDAPNTTIRFLHFINCGGGDGTSDGEAGVYFAHTSGTGTVDSSAFDGNEDGIFQQNLLAGASAADVTMTNNDFGKNVPNGLGDGRAHDNYLNGRSIVATNNRYYNCLNGNCLKAWAQGVTSTGNYFRSNSGRAFDNPSGTRLPWTSNGDTFVVPPASPGGNMIGYADEHPNAYGTDVGMVVTNAKLWIGRANTTVWNNNGATTIAFVNPTVRFITDGVSTPPNLVLQGPGAITGLPTGGTVSGTEPPPPVSPL